MKKVLSVILSLSMLLSITAGIDFSAFAADELTTGKCGENVTYSFDSSTGTLTISGSGTMNKNYSSDSPFYNKTSIKNVIIKDGVTSIGNYVFYGCTGLTSVTIPDSVTSIGYGAFERCYSLTRVNITSLESWCKLSFGEDYDDNVYFADDGRSARVAYNLYLNYELVTDLVIPKSISNINDGAFGGCKSLTSVTIPDNVTNIGIGAFKFCKNLTSLTIQDSIKSISMSAFYGCTGLTSVTIPESVAIINEYAFSGCTNLKNVNYPGSEEQWNKIYIYSSNDNLIFANKVFGKRNHTHTYSANITKNATCTEEGIITCTCTAGDDSYTVAIPATGHRFDNSYPYCLNGCKTVNPNYVAPSVQTPATVSIPKAVELTKVTNGKKSFTVQWKKVKGVDGYQIQYSTNKKMKKAKTKNVKGSKKTKLTVKKLKKGKKYYVRIRTYKTVNGKKVYSKWSAKKTIKTK